MASRLRRILIVEVVSSSSLHEVASSLYALVVVVRGGPVGDEGEDEGEDKRGARARARHCHQMRWLGARTRRGVVVVDLAA